MAIQNDAVLRDEPAHSATVAATWNRSLVPPERVPEQADVVIVGGGIVGVSTAWFLAQQGVSVVLCEKGHIAGEQSGRNWGWVRVLGRDVREVPMMLESLRIWDRLTEETGEDVGFTRSGCLFAARMEKDLDGFGRWLEVAKEHGIESSILDGSSLRQHVHGATVNWKAALYSPRDGRAEPHKAAPAIARAAERAGATVLTCCAMRGIETSAGRVAAVVTEHGTIKTSTVLCAAGTWSALLCRSLGIALPQLKVQGTVVRTAALDGVLEGNLFDRHLGIRRRQDGGYTVAHGTVLHHALTPSTLRWSLKFLPALIKELGVLRVSFGSEFFEEWRTPTTWALDQATPFEKVRVLNPEPNERVVQGIRRILDNTFPQMAGTPIVESWGGMVETTPDVLPVIDSVDRLPGFHIATGFSGHGFGLGPGAGKVAAAMLTGGDAGIDIAPLQLKRFFDGSKLELLSTI
jgi:glycine/D-amino acid oxidase-like deaminating enzyme